jgi:diaminopimelate decarboxylase
VQTKQAYSIQDGRVLLGNRELLELTKECETPFFLYNVDHIRTRARYLREAMSNHLGIPTSIHYAIKANTNPAILHALKSEGLAVDVVSGGEISCALANSFHTSDVLFSGVAKTVREIRQALLLGVKQINVESLGELARIEELAKLHAADLPSDTDGKKTVSIGLRLNPNVCPETHPYITTGLRENKFGMEEDAIQEAVERLKKTDSPLRLRGLSLHIGSQLLDLDALNEALEIGMRVQQEASLALGYGLDRFDAGGGIGIRYETIEEKLEYEIMDQYASLLAKHLKPAIAKGSLKELLLEPGRWLVARSGLLVTEVQYTKSTQHKSFVIVDGGMNLLIRPALYEAEHRIAPLASLANSAEQTVDIVGPICESADFLGRDRRLPEIKQGDRLAVFDAGAYGRSMSSNYNQHGWPHEYIYENETLSRRDSTP